MLPWNAFIKPVVYVFELVFAAVVTFGTADRLLFLKDGNVHCALEDSLGVCSTVITLGSLSMIGAFYALSKRLLAEFLYQSYRYDTETILCFMLSILWFAIAIVTTVFSGPPSEMDTTFHRSERHVIVIFSWILWVFHIISSALAWFAPDHDDAESRLRNLAHAIEEDIPIDLSENEDNTSIGTKVQSSIELQPSSKDFSDMMRRGSSSVVREGSIVAPSTPQSQRQVPPIATLTSAWRSRISSDLTRNEPEDVPSTVKHNEENVTQIDTIPLPRQSTLRRRGVRFQG